jgi:hypothetical protein
LLRLPASDSRRRFRQSRKVSADALMLGELPMSGEGADGHRSVESDASQFGDPPNVNEQGRVDLTPLVLDHEIRPARQDSGVIPKLGQEC